MEQVPSPPRPLADMEREAVLAALDFFEGNRTQAAKALGISRAGILLRLKRMGFVAPAMRFRSSRGSHDLG